MLKNIWYKFHLIVVVMISLLVLVGCSDINSGGSSNSPDENFTGSSFIGEWKSTDSENSLFFLEDGKIKGTCFTDVEDFFSYSVFGNYAIIYVTAEGRKDIYAIAALKDNETLSYKGTSYKKVC